MLSELEDLRSQRFLLMWPPEKGGHLHKVFGYNI